MDELAWPGIVSRIDKIEERLKRIEQAPRGKSWLELVLDHDGAMALLVLGGLALVGTVCALVVMWAHAMFIK